MEVNNPSNPGDIAAPPAVDNPAATPPAPSNEPTPSGSDSDINPSGQAGPAMVPSDRLREETEKRRKAEEELEELRSQQQAPPPQSTGDDELDPDVEDLIRKGAKKLGLVSRQELDEQNLKTQVIQDVKELEHEHANSGAPYVHSDVLKYANTNNLPITSKASLRAAWRDMNADKLAEIERQRAIAQYKESSNSGAERPGSGGSRPPAESTVNGKTPKERTRSRIQQAREHLRSNT